ALRSRRQRERPLQHAPALPEHERGGSWWAPSELLPVEERSLRSDRGRGICDGHEQQKPGARAVSKGGGKLVAGASRPSPPRSTRPTARTAPPPRNRTRTGPSGT